MIKLAKVRRDLAFQKLLRWRETTYANNDTFSLVKRRFPDDSIFANFAFFVVFYRSFVFFCLFLRQHYELFD